MNHSLKIYCAGPIRGDLRHVESYYQIVALVWQLGHTPLTELALSETEAAKASDKDIFLRDLQWLQQADALVAEVSGPSLGVGYEIAYALHALTIPVLCVRKHSSNELSAMITGNFSRQLTIKEYLSGQELDQIVKEFLKDLESDR